MSRVKRLPRRPGEWAVLVVWALIQAIGWPLIIVLATISLAADALAARIERADRWISEVKW